MVKRLSLLGYHISSAGLESDVTKALSWVIEHKGVRYMATANPHSLVVSLRDEIFQSALRQADVLVPDGTGIILASRILNTDPLIKEKVAGEDFFLRFTELASKEGNIKYFFLGSSEKVLSFIRNKIKKEYPSITVCGTYSPPFKERFSDADNQKILEAIRNSKPDVLWVGMTAPKQEKWIWENRLKLDVPFIAAIGAVFDFYAGTKKRSSLFWRKLGLEWLLRFLHEPRRLWERNMISTPIFLSWILKEKIRQTLASK